MKKKVYPQSFKDEVVKYYLTNHTIADTRKRYGVAESTLFEWCKRYKEQHYLSTSDSPRIKHWQQKELHLSKIEQKLEVLGKYPDIATASTDEKNDSHQTIGRSIFNPCIMRSVQFAAWNVL